MLNKTELGPQPNQNSRKFSITRKAVSNIDGNRNAHIQNAEDVQYQYYEQVKNWEDKEKDNGDSDGSQQKYFWKSGDKSNFKKSSNGNETKFRTTQKSKHSKQTQNMKRINRLYTTNNTNHLLVPASIHQSFQHQSIHDFISQDSSYNPISNINKHKKSASKSQSKSQSKSTQYNKNHPPHTTKEELYEENMKLKGFVNQLRDTLTRQKVQTELQKKKNRKFTVQLNREFKKELYYQNNSNNISINMNNNINRIAEQEQRMAKIYTSQDSDQDLQFNQEQSQFHNSHPFLEMMPKFSNYKIPACLGPPCMEPHSSEYMIAGVKQKYEELKIQHEKVVKELRRVKAVDVVKKLEEISVYCSTLEDSNSKLATALEITKKKLAAYENPALEQKEGKNADMLLYAQAALMESNEKMLSLKTKNANYRQQINKMKKNMKEQEEVIKYLEGLLLAKSTMLHNQQKSQKKSQIALEQVITELKQEKKYSQQIKDSYMNQLQQITLTYETKIYKDRELFQEALVEKNVEIKKLMKEIGYYSSIVQNWKSEEDKEKQKSQNGIKIIDAEKTVDLSSSINQGFRLTERREMEKQYDHKIMEIVSQTNRSNAKPREEDLIRSSKKQQKPIIEERVRKSSAIKHAETSKKTRKVPFEQISNLAEFMRYRLVGSKVSMEQALQLLNFIPTQNDVLMTQSQILWRNKYITQQQLFEILQKEPFNISKSMSELLSRYIVQDEQFFQNGDMSNRYVYQHPQNQIQRIISKSILKSFIQSSSPSSSSLINNSNICQLHKYYKQQWQKILDKNFCKIHSPLISIAPSGYIDKQKWNQLLTSLNVPIEEELREWCVGVMLVESQAIGKLRYRGLVPDSV